MVSSNNKGNQISHILVLSYLYRAAITPNTPARPTPNPAAVICGAAPSEAEVEGSETEVEVLVAVALPSELVIVVVINDDEGVAELEPDSLADPLAELDPLVEVTVADEASDSTELVTDEMALLALLRALPAAPVTLEAMFPPSEVTSEAAPSAPVTAAEAMLRPPSTAVEAAPLAPSTMLLMESPTESWARTEVEERRRRVVRVLMLSCMVAVVCLFRSSCLFVGGCKRFVCIAYLVR